MTKWEMVQELKGLIASIITAGVVVVAASGYVMNLAIDDKVSKKVAEELAKMDIGTDAKIIAMDDEIDAANAKADANTTRIDGNERRVEQAFAALMGRDE